MRNFLLPFLFLVFFFSVSGHALTDPYIKEQQLWIDLYYESDALDYTPPSRFRPADLATASEDPLYWINEVLPFEQDRYADVYFVVPQLWAVAPVVSIPETSPDFQAVIDAGNWFSIDINKYLQRWVLETMWSVPPGDYWLSVIFAHSNYYKSDPGRYKTIFANLMALDPNDQVWYFVRNVNGGFDLHKYRVVESYHTYPKDPNALTPPPGDATTINYWCTHGLDGRRIVKSVYMWEANNAPVQYVDPYASLDANMKYLINQAVYKISYLWQREQAYAVIRFFKAIENIKAAWSMNAEKNLLMKYIEEKLASIYPQ